MQILRGIGGGLLGLLIATSALTVYLTDSITSPVPVEAAARPAAENFATTRIEPTAVIPIHTPAASTTSESQPTIGVRVGIFGELSNADRIVERLRDAGFDPLVVLSRSGHRVVRYVYAGAFPSEREAQGAANALRSKGFEALVEPLPPI